MKAKYVVAGMAVSSSRSYGSAGHCRRFECQRDEKKISKRVERGAKQMGIQL